MHGNLGAAKAGRGARRRPDCYRNRQVQVRKASHYVARFMCGLQTVAVGSEHRAVTSSQPAHIWLARHGQTQTNREGRFCGHSETSLTDLGKEQAARLGERLRPLALKAVYTSDYSRAIETAAIAVAGRNLTAHVDPDLRELHYGEWELQLDRDIRTRYPEQHELMRNEDPTWHPPGGETLGMVRMRTAAALERIAAAHAGEHVLIVSHGTAIACMLAEVFAMAPTHTLRIEVANCSLSGVTAMGGRFGLTLFNETQHLTTPAAK